MTQPQTNEKVKVSGGRKVLACFGIFFVVVGVFLSSFGLSFKVMLLPEKNEGEMNELEKLQTEVDSLELENRRLKEENDILKDGKASSKSTSTSSSKSSKNDKDLY